MYIYILYIDIPGKKQLQTKKVKRSSNIHVVKII